MSARTRRGKQGKQGGGPRRARRNGGNQMIPHPPQMPNYGITREVRLRFLSTSAFAAQITFQNLLDTILIATGTTAVYDLFEAVKIKRVEAWASSVLGTAVTCIVSFDGTTAGAQGDQKVHTDTSMGIEPAYVSARPDRRTLAGDFQISSAANAFFLDCPTGTVIDVSMSMRQPVNGAATVAQNVAVGAVLGAVAYRGLDGKALATTVLPVQGVFYAL